MKRHELPEPFTPHELSWSEVLLYALLAGVMVGSVVGSWFIR